MVNLPLLKQKKDIHICKRFGVVVVIVATSLTHPTSVSMGMNMRLLEEINLVVVILNKTNNMEINMKAKTGKKYMNGIDAMKDAFAWDNGNQIIVESGSREICTIHGQSWSSDGGGGITDEEREIANLIIYAPEMLELLKNIKPRDPLYITHQERNQIAAIIVEIEGSK